MAKIKNPIQYTSRTFNTILNDINSDLELADKPNWFKKIWAGIGDVISMWINAIGNNLVLRTSYTRQNVADLLELIDYYLNPQTTSNGDIIYYIDKNTSFPFNVSITDLKAQTAGSLNISSKIFEARSGIIVNSITENFTIVDIGNDLITVSRKFTTGEKVIFSGIDLPVPLVTGTEYWIVKISDTTIKIAESLINAYNNITIDLIDIGSGTRTISLYSVLVNSYQQESQDSRSIGVSDGITPFQDFSLVEQNIIEDTIVVVINGEIYIKVETLVFSESTDKHFEVIYTTDNVAIIRFGNGDFGIVPPAFDINVSFAVGGGIDSNINSINSISIYRGSANNITGVSNSKSLSGGNNIEDIETGKRVGPLLLKTRDRFITSEDGASLAEDFGGISQVRVNGNEYGVLSSQIIIIPTGGGITSTQFKNDLEQYLINRTVLGSIDTRVLDATYIIQNVISNVKILPGFIFTDILKYIEIAWRLFFSETSLEIKRDFESNGITSATNLINTIFGTSFSASDFDQIQKLIENLIPNLIGTSIYESDVFGYIDTSVTGIDYLTITSPSFPIILTKNESSTDGTINISEII